MCKCASTFIINENLIFHKSICINTSTYKLSIYTSVSFNHFTYTNPSTNVWMHIKDWTQLSYSRIHPINKKQALRLPLHLHAKMMNRGNNFNTCKCTCTKHYYRGPWTCYYQYNLKPFLLRKYYSSSELLPTIDFIITKCWFITVI